MVKVSILLAVYNNKDDILGAMQSIINQSYTDWELIIIDDCSTDGTSEILCDFLANTKSNIKLLKNDKNYGVYVSLNKGLLVASGDYICRIDSDDIVADDYLKINIDILDKMPQYISTISKAERRKEHKRLSVFWGEITLFYRRSIINEIGYYDSVRFAADTEFLYRMIKKYGNDKIHRINKITYFAKYRENSLTTSPDTAIDSAIRKDYMNRFRVWHAKKNFYMPFPLTERKFIVNDKML